LLSSAFPIQDTFHATDESHNPLSIRDQKYAINPKLHSVKRSFDQLNRQFQLNAFNT